MVVKDSFHVTVVFEKGAHGAVSTWPNPTPTEAELDHVRLILESCNPAHSQLS